MADTVLVVDDDAPQACAMALLLAYEGYEARAVYTAGAAQAAFMSERPAAVLTDVQMPGQTGAELVRVLGAVPGPRVAFVLTSSPNRLMARDIEFGHHVLLPKPFTAEQLFAAVQVALIHARHGPPPRSHALTRPAR